MTTLETEALRAREGGIDPLPLVERLSAQHRAIGVTKRIFDVTLIEGRRRYPLTNRMAVVHQNRSETDYLYHEIFENRLYLRHGIRLPSRGCVFDVGANIGLFTLFVSRLCPNVRVHSFCRVEQSILMPGVRVGRHARIRRAIIDRDVLIPRGALIGYNLDEDRQRHTVTDSGVVVVTTDDEPLIGPLNEEALRFEAEADRRGGQS